MFSDVAVRMGADGAAFEKCLATLAAKQPRHRVRKTYYQMENGLKSLGIALPPTLRLSPSNGWVAKAVDTLSDRISFENFSLPNDDLDNWGIPELVEANNLDIVAPMATTSALIHACSFVAVWRGDTAAGEPPAVIHVSDATRATGIWDTIRQQLKAALLVVETDDNGEPSYYAFLTPEHAYGIRKQAGNQWSIRKVAHRLGYVSMWVLPHSPSLDAPFGKSRISRAMMSIVDSTLRTLARGEIGAEFYSAPQRYIMGAPEEAFSEGNKWQAYLGRILAMPYVEVEDEDGGIKPVLPQVGQFSQQSPEGNIAHLRMYAAQFAGESELSLNSLGIVTDNPSSAEAMYAATHDLLITAERTAKNFTPGWSRAMRAAAQLVNNSTTPIEELNRLSVRWRDPAYSSRSATADAVGKLIAAGVYDPNDPVTWEAVGISDADIQRMAAFRRRQQASQWLKTTEATAAADSVNQTPAPPVEAAQTPAGE